MVTVKSYKDLEIWQLSVGLTVKIYKLLSTFPSEEKFGIISQIKDAVVSVSSNIAESYGRYHYKDKVKFLYNSRGSLLEVESQLLVSHALGFISKSQTALYNEIMQDIIKISVKINNYCTRIKQSISSI